MKKHDPQFLTFATQCAKGNEEAAQFLVLITEAAHFFDDLYDGDTPMTKRDIYNALWLTMVALPRNAFYRQFFVELAPLVSNAITNWRVANFLEEAPAGSDDFRVAFIVRSSYAELIQQTALICGGPEWAAEVGVRMRRECHSESWKDYLQSLEARHGNVQSAETAGQQSGDDRRSAGEPEDRGRTDGPWPRAIRMGEDERSVGSSDAAANLRTTDADR
jgi:hypothetical protein